MEMPYNLQRLPPEALMLLRYMAEHDGISTTQMEQEGGLSNRLAGRAIRRLVNFDMIELRAGLYYLTSDGRLTADQLIEYNKATASDAGNKIETLSFERRLTAVVPRTAVINAPIDIFIGVNPPSNHGPRLPEAVQIDLRVTAAGGSVSPQYVSLSVPVDKAATPGRVILTPDRSTMGRPIRVRVDVYQALDISESEPLGGMYADIKVATPEAITDKSMRAVGMDLRLKPPKVS